MRFNMIILKSYGNENSNYQANLGFNIQHDILKKLRETNFNYQMSLRVNITLSKFL